MERPSTTVTLRRYSRSLAMAESKLRDMKRAQRKNVVLFLERVTLCANHQLGGIGMKSRSRQLILASALAGLCALTAFTVAKPDTELPESASVKTTTVLLPWPQDGYTFSTSYAFDGTKVFVFPTFGLSSASIGSQSSPTVALGVDADPVLKKGANLAETHLLELSIVDLGRDNNIRDSILRSAKLETRIANATVDQPEFTSDFLAELLLHGHAASTQPIVLAKRDLPRTVNTEIAPLTFWLTPEILPLLQRAKVRDLAVRISASYRAKFFQKDVIATLDVVANQAQQLANAIAASPDGKKPSFLITLGGSVTSETSYKKHFDSFVNLSVFHRLDLKDPSRASLAEDFTKTLIKDLATSTVTSLDKIRADAEATTAFLLDNVIQVNATIGQLDKLSVETERDYESYLEKLKEDHKKGKSSTDTKVGATIMLPDLPVPLGFDAKHATNDEWDNLYKEYLKTLLKHRSTFKAIASGKMNYLFGLNLDQVNGSVQAWSNQIRAQAGTFTSGIKPYSVNLSLASLLSVRPTGSPFVPLGAILDWTRLDEKAPFPAGYQICDGSSVTDPESPFFGKKVPDLTDKFTMGVPPSRLSEVGGVNTIVTSGGHTHTFGGRTEGGGGQGPRGGGDRSLSENTHTHAFSGGTSESGAHSHGDNRPAFLGVLKLIRVK
jgi:hypothetical protein